jgi:hypothetical protein
VPIYIKYARCCPGQEIILKVLMRMGISLYKRPQSFWQNSVQSGAIELLESPEVESRVSVSTATTKISTDEIMTGLSDFSIREDKLITVKTKGNEGNE